MPIYEYVCSACERRIEVVHGINAAGPTVCEACGGAMRKALSAPAIHFKGSGWAKKDARSAAASATAAAKKDDAKPDAPASPTADTAAPAPAPAATTPAPAAPAPASGTPGS
jgi:putative FmdB family regulatory protein